MEKDGIEGIMISGKFPEIWKLELGAVMVVSSTVLFIAFSKHKTLPSRPTTLNLRSCLSSDEKRKERSKKKKKRVKFAENVKDTKGNGEEYRKEKEKIDRICRNDINKIHANRLALYNGILRDRVHRPQCSY
ncbi:uncharacterized protein [Euphorbia lathyris]|uniref:uncharacterized protein n=1 Tax=Euphorbia lathyris TaxID=212925 RepID=UPI00331390AB